MSSRIAQYSARLIEVGWLLAVMAVPLFFNVWSNRVFEPDKLTLLRSIALTMAAAGLVWRIERGWPGRAAFRAWLGTPLLVPVLVLTAVYVLSTATSIVPWLSLTGSYNRLQGLYTWLAYVVVFLSIVTFLAGRDQLDRLVTALILPSLPVALYGIIQRAGLDPMPWLGDVTQRVASTMGNSIFVSAYLIMVLPLTLIRLIEAFRDLGDEAREGAYVYATIGRVAGYLVLIAFQFTAIVLSGSRGPWLGLYAGVFFALLLLSVTFMGRFGIAGVAGVIVAFGLAPALFLVVFNLPNSPLAPLREVAYIGRLGRVFETESGTGKVRVLIWDGAIELIGSDPLRTVIGWGPESMHWAYNPHYPPELGNYESRNASPDRSHNETLDALATTGVVGLLAYLTLFTSLFYYGLRWLGLIDSTGRRNLFLGLWFGGGLLSVLGFHAWADKWTYFGVALPAGMVVGLAVYLSYFAIQTARGKVQMQARPGRLLMIGLLAGLIGHFIEIHFGIAIAATRTLFFAMSGALVVVGALAESRGIFGNEPPPAAPAASTADAPTSSARRRRASQAQRTRVSAGPQTPPTWAWASQALIMVAILVTLIFDFVVTARPEMRSLGPLAWLLGTTWVIGSMLLCGEAVVGLIRSGGWKGSDATSGALVYGGLTIGVTGAYAISHWLLLSSATPGSGADTSGALLGMYYLMLLMLLVVWAWLLLRQDPDPGRFARIRAAWLYPLAGVAALVLALYTNLNEVRADIYYKEGWNLYHAQGMYDEAVFDYDRAIRLDPGEDYYYLFKGKALLEKADAEADRFEQGNQADLAAEDASEYTSGLSGAASERDRAFEDALNVLEQARVLAPSNTDHYANLARAYQIWGDRTFDKARRAERLALSREWFQRATGPDLSPNNAGLYEELATTEFLDGDVDAAMADIDKALAIDPRFMHPYRVRARIHRELGEYEEAASDYRTYLESREGRSDMPGWSELAYVLGQSNDLVGAKEANLKVLELAKAQGRQPDPTTLTNLAILARDAGQREEACGYIQQGLAVAPEDPSLLGLGEQLGCPAAESPTGGTAP
jgi:tetratricopeptide (TPR) repeat protein/O-antigen ligase